MSSVCVQKVCTVLLIGCWVRPVRYGHCQPWLLFPLPQALWSSREPCCLGLGVVGTQSLLGGDFWGLGLAAVRGHNPAPGQINLSPNFVAVPLVRSLCGHALSLGAGWCVSAGWIPLAGAPEGGHRGFLETLLFSVFFTDSVLSWLRIHRLQK